MKTSNTLKIIIITFSLILLSNVSFGQPVSGSKNDVKKVFSCTTPKKTTKTHSVAGSKRGILPTMAPVTVSKTYLV